MSKLTSAITDLTNDLRGIRKSLRSAGVDIGEDAGFGEISTTLAGMMGAGTVYEAWPLRGRICPRNAYIVDDTEQLFLCVTSDNFLPPDIEDIYELDVELNVPDGWYYIWDGFSDGGSYVEGNGFLELHYDEGDPLCIYPEFIGLSNVKDGFYVKNGICYSDDSLSKKIFTLQFDLSSISAGDRETAVAEFLYGEIYGVLDLIGFDIRAAANGILGDVKVVATTSYKNIEISKLPEFQGYYNTGEYYDSAYLHSYPCTKRKINPGNYVWDQYFVDIHVLSGDVYLPSRTFCII